MKKQLQIVLIAAVVLLAGASGYLFVQNQKANEQLAGSRMSEQEVQDKYGRTIEAIAEIQDSLNAIAPEGSGVFAGKSAAERNAAGPNREEALDRIAALRTSIADNKERIHKLETDLKKSGVKVNGLEKLIANLKKSVAEKEDQVAMLTQQVNDLHTQVDGLNQTVAAKDDTIHVKTQQVEEKRREVATVYYVIGSKKELADAGVIKTSGGVLGLGKTVQPVGAPSVGHFTPLDTDYETVIMTGVPKVRVISAQPPSSYELRAVDGHMELHIVDAESFRKVKQVVLLAS